VPTAVDLVVVWGGGDGFAAERSNLAGSTRSMLTLAGDATEAALDTSSSRAAQVGAGSVGGLGAQGSPHAVLAGDALDGEEEWDL
jgi:hypothetical protein